MFSKKVTMKKERDFEDAVGTNLGMVEPENFMNLIIG